jgi:FlaA1/EpsC-like NDP-sugar epimerase
VVRFGNVLGSRGSVIPIFMQQIRDGGPVTITHPDVERYFMTIPEAAKLVIEAQSMANGGEIYILDMGEPIRIIDLAKDMIRLTGLEPGEDIKIKFTGLRPGEKLREELLSQDENAQATSHKKIFTAQRTTISRDVIDSIIDQLIVDCNNSDNLDLRRQLMDSLRVAEQKTKKGRERIVKLFSDDQPPHSTNRKQHNP